MILPCERFNMSVTISLAIVAKEKVLLINSSMNISVVALKIGWPAERILIFILGAAHGVATEIAVSHPISRTRSENLNSVVRRYDIRWLVEKDLGWRLTSNTVTEF